MVSKIASILALALFLGAGQLPAKNSQKEISKTILNVIDKDLQAGKIDYQTSLVLKLQAVRNPDGLPATYRAAELSGFKCGTLPVLEAVRNLGQVDRPTNASLLSMLARPSTTFSYDSPGGNFKIHYDTLGANAVPTADADTSGIPDYVEKTAAYADSSWELEVNQMGYTPPPSDGVEGGDSKYDIYILGLGTGLYGYAQPENPGPQTWNDYSSYLAVHNNMVTGFTCPNTDPEGVQLGRLKVTIAHEFFHAVQFGYDIFDASWFYEASSTWMEDEVFDASNDYYCYLPGHFLYPEYSLQEANGFSEYAHCVWHIFLTENHGDSLVRKFWEGCISSTAINSVQNVLINNYGTSLGEQFQEFTSWNYVTGYRDDGVHYSEGAVYDTCWIMKVENSFPFFDHVPSQSPFDERPDNLSCNFVRMNTAALSGKLILDFDGQDGTTWGASVIMQRTPGDYEFDQISLNPGAAGELVIDSIDQFEIVMLIPSNLSTSGTNRNYTYSAFQCLAIPGDANASANLTLADIIATTNYVFNKPGFPVCASNNNLCWLSDLLCRGDWNGSATVTLSDVIQGVNKLFDKPGGPWDPLPSGGCCLPLP